MTRKGITKQDRLRAVVLTGRVSAYELQTMYATDKLTLEQFEGLLELVVRR